MAIFQNKTLKKKTILLLHSVVVGLLLFVIFQQQAVLFVKDLVERLNLHGDVELFLARGWASIKIIINSPSLFGFFVFVMHVLCLGVTIIYFLGIVYIPNTHVDEILEEPNYTRLEPNKVTRLVYLENSSLLF